MADHDEALRRFVEDTSYHAATCDELMGGLVQQSIAREEFSAYCAAYADGVRYIYDRVKIAPDAMLFADTPCIPPDGCLTIARSDIAWAITEGLVKTPMSEPFILNQDQAAFVKGVADAHRLYCSIRGVKNNHVPDRYVVSDVSKVAPVELHDAAQPMLAEDTASIVRLAMLERNMNKATTMAQVRRKPRAAQAAKSWATKAQALQQETGNSPVKK